MKLFDTHCHFERADPTVIAPVLARAKAAGVEKLMVVGGSPALNEAALVAAQVAAECADAPKVYMALGCDREQVSNRESVDVGGGLRPTDKRRGDSRGEALPGRRLSSVVCPELPPVVCRLSSTGSPSPAAIGEIGLDYHYSPETREAQMKLFAAQLEAARVRDLPVVIHTREAAADTVALLREIPAHGIIHCFTGDPDEAKAYLDLGFYISFSGIVTFRAADNVRASALVVPDERILIETDAPFLAPVPLRGNPNEPAFVKYTCEFLAKLRGVNPEAFAELTFANAERVLG